MHFTLKKLIDNLIDRMRATDKLTQKMQQVENSVNLLPLSEAKERALKLLIDPKKFNCEPANSSEVNNLLPAELQGIARHYRTIKTVRGEAELNFQGIEPSKLKTGFFTIGVNSDHVELVIKPMEEAIYEIDGTEDDNQIEDSKCPSLYHWIIMTDYVLYGND